MGMVKSVEALVAVPGVDLTIKDTDGRCCNDLARWVKVDILDTNRLLFTAKWVEKRFHILFITC